MFNIKKNNQLLISIFRKLWRHRSQKEKFFKSFAVLMFWLTLKKDRMVNCRASGCTNRADRILENNSYNNVIYHDSNNYNHGIFKTLAYLMPETYSKPYQIFTMMRHIENPCIVRKVYVGISRNIQGELSNIQPCLGILRNIKTYSGIDTYWSILRHIQKSV